MHELLQGIARFARDEEGATMVEYGLMVALIAVVCVVAISVIGQELNEAFVRIQECLETPAACV